jgi:tripartite-type tricarboxylate transporter receptor subunit TctC
MKIVGLLAVALLGLINPDSAHAQSYPSRPVRMVTSVPAGATPDVLLRVIAKDLSAEFKQSVVVENRTGGAGIPSAMSVLTSPADGHTLYLGTIGIMMLNPHVLPSMPFDALTAFQPVGLISSSPLVLTVNPKFTTARTLKELVDLAKAKPGALNYGTIGPGSTSAIAQALFNKAADIRVTGIPYRGTPEFVQALLTGDLQMAMTDVGPVRQALDAGNLVALGVTSRNRSSIVPNVPTFHEQGYDVNIDIWYAIYVHADTPPEIVKTLSSTLKKVMASPAIAERWRNLGLQVGTLYGEDFVDYHKSQYKFWSTVLPPMNLKAAK